MNKVKANETISEKAVIKVKLVRSLIGCTERELATARGLGLKRIGTIKTLEDTPAVNGMIKKLSRIVSIVE